MQAKIVSSFVLAGFYLKTSMDGGKTPYDVVSLQGSISVGLGLDLVVVRAGIEGLSVFFVDRICVVGCDCVTQAELISTLE